MITTSQRADTFAERTAHLIPAAVDHALALDRGGEPTHLWAADIYRLLAPGLPDSRWHQPAAQAAGIAIDLVLHHN